MGLAVGLESRRSFLVAGGLLLLAAVPISLGLARAITRPLRQLAHAAEEIGRGQLDVVLPRPAGETAALVRAFASMVVELKARGQLEAMLAGRQRSADDATVRDPPFHPSGGATGFGAGTVFADRYLVLSVLGEGGMGTVYRVRDRDLDDEVALKVLKPAMDDPAAETAPVSGPTAEFLRQEIRLARMITHVNVVRVHDFGEAEGVRYFSMEYVAGTTLREILGQGRLLDLLPTLQIAKQVCRGLAAVHKAGIIHGDLKPQNVMLMSSGVVKLMDFGVARTRSAVSPADPIAGTPAYMSPEQARGGELDERSDLYSAGALMFELFTGRCPFLGADMYATMRMHLDEEPPDPRRLRGEIPAGLARIILACLDKSPLRRPASAADLERRLMRVRV
jgi:eukaryotic-like serine/threonine-protein kinase